LASKSELIGINGLQTYTLRLVLGRSGTSASKARPQLTLELGPFLWRRLGLQVSLIVAAELPEHSSTRSDGDQSRGLRVH
jgi:hypothetical protein